MIDALRHPMQSGSRWESHLDRRDSVAEPLDVFMTSRGRRAAAVADPRGRRQGVRYVSNCVASHSVHAGERAVSRA